MGDIMIVLRKKRLILCAYFIGISLFVCIYSVASFNQKTLQTMALPISNKVVVLDAGHGLPDERCSTDKMVLVRAILIFQ